MKTPSILLACVCFVSVSALAEEPINIRQIALDSLISIGADVPNSTGRCAECHSMAPEQIRKWGITAMDFAYDCLSQTDAKDTINCARKNPDDPNSPFDASKLGIYAAGAHTSLFRNLFFYVYGQDYKPAYQQFLAQVQMPAHGKNLMSEQEFQNVLDWNSMSMPLLDELVAKIEFPTECKTEITPDLQRHLAEMNQRGWQVVNREAGMAMFACSDEDPLHCFNQGQYFPLAATLYPNLAQDYPDQTLRILRKVDFTTAFWTRSSADGRFMANGHLADGTPPEANAVISDLADVYDPTGHKRDIGVDAFYDPGFFPDNSGFVFQGRSFGMCPMSVLQDPETTSIDFSEEGCSYAQNRPGLYQAVGASLDGGDYIIANSTFVSDQGSGYEISYEYPFGASSIVTLTPVINNGATYQNLAPSQLPIPFMGDSSLSPSGEMLVSRLNGIDQFGYAKPLGYKFHKIHKDKTSTGYHYEIQEIGSLCMPGQKATVSFDERMVVTYGYEDGHANLYLADLAIGKWMTIVRTQPGQFALFPHFRSDGWIYFMLYDRNSRQRYLIASDAAIKLANSVR